MINWDRHCDIDKVDKVDKVDKFPSFFFCFFHFYHLLYAYFYFIIKFYTHLFSVWPNLLFVQCAQFFSLTFTIYSLHLRSTVFQIPIMTISAFSILALTSTIHSLHCSLFIWEIYHSLNFHHLICIFHFYHLFYA